MTSQASLVVPLQVATLVKADWLFLLTDVDHLYTDNPNVNPNARPIYEVPDIGTLQVLHASHVFFD